MCLRVHKDNTEAFIAAANTIGPTDKIVVWKLLDIFPDGRVCTPYRKVLVTGTYMKAQRWNHCFGTYCPVRPGLRKNPRSDVNAGIHAYTDKRWSLFRTYNSEYLFVRVVVKAYVRYKDVIGVGEYDMAATQIELDAEEFTKAQRQAAKYFAKMTKGE